MLHGVLMVAAVSLNATAAPPAKEPSALVGQVIIVGNEVTPRGIILARLPLSTGQRITGTDIAAADRSLLWLRLLGIRSTVLLIDGGDSVNAIKDVLVEVRETSLTPLLASPVDRLREGLVLTEEYLIGFFVFGNLRGGPFREVPFFDPSVRAPER